MGAVILGSEVRPDGSVLVTYGRQDFSQGQLVIPQSMRGDASLQSIVDMLYDPEALSALTISRKQERNRSSE